jgi:hypothetical protein
LIWVIISSEKIQFKERLVLKEHLVIFGLGLMLTLSGCGNNKQTENIEFDNNTNMRSTSHTEMNHSGTSEVPKELKEAINPQFKLGSQAIITAGHMPGMKGATTTIVGAYDTNVYAVSYTPTIGGKPIKHHKWVIQQELKDSSDKLYEPGSKAVLEAEHMPGMKEATATVESSKFTTVYMVDYSPTTGGETVKNHKWVTGDELKAK